MQEVWVSAVEGALHSAGWAGGVACGLAEERGEEDGGAQREARRDGIGSGRRMVQSTTSQAGLAVWHKWLWRAGGACAFLSPSISNPFFPDRAGPSHGATLASDVSAPSKGSSS